MSEFNRRIENIDQAWDMAHAAHPHRRAAWVERTAAEKFSIGGDRPLLSAFLNIKLEDDMRALEALGRGDITSEQAFKTVNSHNGINLKSIKGLSWKSKELVHESVREMSGLHPGGSSLDLRNMVENGALSDPERAALRGMQVLSMLDGRFHDTHRWNSGEAQDHPDSNLDKLKTEDAKREYGDYHTVDEYLADAAERIDAHEEAARKAEEAVARVYESGQPAKPAYRR